MTSFSLSCSTSEPEVCLSPLPPQCDALRYGDVSISVVGGKLGSLCIGEQSWLQASVVCSGTPGDTVWSSSDERIARVHPDGHVTAVSPGTATITATIGTGSNFVVVRVEACSTDAGRDTSTD